VHAAAGEDGDLRAVVVVEVVVSCLYDRLVCNEDIHRSNFAYPEPVILEIGAVAGLGNVHVGVCCHAVTVDGSGWTLCNLEPSALGTAYASMNIPDAGTTCGVEVVLDELGAWRGSLSLHDHVRPFDAATISGSADLNDSYRVIFVGPGAARSHEC
jgi:hypothetical protein